MNGVKITGFSRAVPMIVALTLTAGLATAPLAAQTTAGTQAVPDIEFPQWSKDLRRAEVVAFGTIPFTWLVSTLIVDISRTVAHNGSRDYWPWPLKPSGAPAMTNDEFISSIGIAFGISVTAAIADHIIIKYKRRKAEILKQQHPPREPAIIRRPVSEFTGGNGTQSLLLPPPPDPSGTASSGD